jgi:hypothetical protein
MTPATVRLERVAVQDLIDLLTQVVDAAEDDHVGPSTVLAMGADAANLRALLRDALVDDAPGA